MAAGITRRGVDYRLHGDGPDFEAPDRERWAGLLGSLGSGIDRLVVSRQIHGHAIGIHASATSGLTLHSGLDAHVTGVAGLALALTVADCVPVYLIHPESRSIALAHCGWRGIAAGVLEGSIAALLRVSGGSVCDIVMHCGISICGNCYEVGSEVILALTGHHTGPATIDLRSIIAERARSMGVGQVTLSTWCAAHHDDRFYSHRRSQGADGRMAAYLGVRVA